MVGEPVGGDEGEEENYGSAMDMDSGMDGKDLKIMKNVVVRVRRIVSWVANNVISIINYHFIIIITT